MTNTWPTASSKYTENIKKFKFTERSIISIDIIIISMFFLFSINPKTPIKKRAEFTDRA